MGLTCDPLAIHCDVGLFQPPFFSRESLKHDPAHKGHWIFICGSGWSESHQNGDVGPMEIWLNLIYMASCFFHCLFSVLIKTWDGSYLCGSQTMKLSLSYIKKRIANWWFPVANLNLYIFPFPFSLLLALSLFRAPFSVFLPLQAHVYYPEYQLWRSIDINGKKLRKRTGFKFQ